jgi:hypothetical protein
MAIDQRDVSSTLRFMDDRALQQYAAMHKNDPYIFPLAFQESQNRQRLRMSQQTAQGMQPQPKVADQALAQMAPQQLPEDRGIAALDAPNMQQMADGGIAGYDDDANFAARSEPVVMMAGGGIARYNGAQGSVTGIAPELLSKYQKEATEMGMGTRVQFSPDVKAVVGQIQDMQESAYLKEEQQRMLQGGRFAPFPAMQQQDAQAPAAAPKVTPTYSQDDYSGMDRRIMSGSQLPSIQSITPPAKAAPAEERVAAPKADTTRAAPVRAAGEPAAKTETGGLDTLMAEYERKQDLAKGASKNADVQYASTLRGEAAKLVADEEKRIKDQIDPYKDREARLLKQEKGLEGMGDKYLGLALLEAGAAMMRTPGKFNFGKVVGAGIPVGSARYVQGMEKISAAKDKFADARDRLDDLRLNRADMNARDIKAAKTEARTLERQAEALFYTGAKEDLKMTNQGITDLFKAAADNLKTDKTIAADLKNTMIREGSANARSAAQIAATLSAPDKVLFAQALKKNDNDAFKAWAAVQQAQGDKFNLRNSYADYLKAFAGKDGLTPPMSIEAYAGKMGALLPR